MSIFGSKSVRLKAMLKALKEQELSAIAPMLARLLEISRDPLSDAEDLSVLCETDPAISARLLKTANSAFYYTPDRPQVSDMRSAIIRIGFSKAQEIIISACMSGLLTSKYSSADFSMWELWRHSYAVGIANRLIYQKKFMKPAFDPFLAGLLHDIGIIIENQFLHDESFFDAARAREKNHSLLSDEERHHMGFSHEEIGEAAAQLWNFPEHITAVIGHHHDLQVENERHQKLVHVTRLSECICFLTHMGYCDFSEAHAEELIVSKHVLNIENEIIEQVANELKDEIESLSQAGWFPCSYRAA